MEKIIRLAAANIRKNKGQSFSFVVIIIFSALLFYVGLITSMDYKKSFDKKAEEFNAPDVTFSIQSRDKELETEFKEVLLADKDTKEIDMRYHLMGRAEFPFQENSINRLVAFFDCSSTEDFNIVEKTKKEVDNPIYLPWQFSTGGAYDLGDSFVMTLYGTGEEKQKIEFEVAGFYEDIYYSTINSLATGVLLEKEQLQQLSDQTDKSMEGMSFWVKLKDKTTEGFSGRYGGRLRELAGDNVNYDAVNYDLIKSARTVTSSVGALMIMGFSSIVFFVSLVVVKFRIVNSIEEEMKNIGALRAIGYTGKQLMGAFCMQFFLLALLGSIVGIALSFLCIPFVETMFASQTGVMWRANTSITAILVTILGIEGLIALVSITSSAKIRKYLPVEALHQGVASHNFKKNYLPLESTKINLHTSISFKQLAGGRKQNLVVGLILMGITFVGIFTMVLYYNIAIEPDAFYNMVSGQKESVRFTTSSKEEAWKLREKLKESQEVSDAFYIFSGLVEAEKGGELYSFVSDSFSEEENPNWLFEGRFPKHENEVALGGATANKLQKKQGDTIVLSANGNKEEYLITGLIQGAYYMGKDVCMTGEGYQKLVPQFVFTQVSVNLEEKIDPDEYIKEMEKEHSEILESVNAKSNVMAAMGTYEKVVKIIAMVIAVVTVLIIFLVLYLVIKTSLIRRKKELAIQKAIGFTTIQLAWQSAGALLPVIIAGTLLGCVLGKLTMNSFLGVVYSGIGIMQPDFLISIEMLIGLFLALTITGCLISFGVSMRIRHVTPTELMSE